MESVGAAFPPGIVGQQGAGHPLGPSGLAVLGAVAHVHHPEQVTAPRGLVLADQQLAEEEVLFWGGPEQRLEHVAAEEPAPSVGGEPGVPGPAAQGEVGRGSAVQGNIRHGPPASQLRTAP
jgi:hypothetical protein